ncbi:MAG TPA: signal recognition particle protein [Phycisphaerae bacterium]|jgi:signal recognition particle subunit SRP54|nr:signal recognition particle protein [Phycisphaerae bacterium]HOB76494.1 signal recognition particle protein [Phycisphaerae bacterium]HOJ53708.1 signal recognition particle protein [Phycisphaerae bacterium]HOL27973.1 signal recognition particle protein [Phycisphaerae bacterium]HPP22380.1 signal recognition particle protein [Phycisphaerae bacterium]
MFEALTERFGDVFRRIRGRGRITEENVAEALREVRTALLEADVHVSVVKQFTDEVMKKALGAEVIKTLHPDQVLIKIVHDELVQLMGPVDPRIPYVTPGPTVILMAGLQGSGKTTTCGKLAKLIMSRGKRPLMVAADLKRPAAIDQLEVIGGQVGVPVYAERGEQNPVKVCRNGVLHARKTDRDVVILDTAGRLAIDDELMNEIHQVEQATQPHQVFLVIDAMTGQDAVNTAKRFNERLELDGLILTKFDSDTRGGAALSAKMITGKPIKFIGTGEKLEALEEFHADRMAGRILGMGDVVTLVEKAQQQFDAKEAEKLQKKMASGMTLDDFMAQMNKMKSMGSMKDIMKLIPGMSTQVDGLEVDDRELDRFEAIIQSMTPKERRNPEIIEASRRRRIAKGSGTDPKDVSGLIKSFTQVRDMMKVMSNMSMMDRLRSAAQFAKMAAGGIMPRLKGGSTMSQKRRETRKEKRQRRKKHRR